VVDTACSKFKRLTFVQTSAFLTEEQASGLCDLIYKYIQSLDLFWFSVVFGSNDIKITLKMA